MKRGVRSFALAALGALLVFSVAAPRAGTYIPLKVNLVTSVGFEILNDNPMPEGEYAYLDSGRAQGNPWIWFDSGTGRFRMTQARSDTTGRYVQVLLNNLEAGPIYGEGNCAKYAGTPNVPANIRWFWFTSGGELRDEDADGVMEPGDPSYPTLNFKDMAVGETRYCSLAIRFQTFDDQCEYDWGGAPSPETADNVVKVTVEDVNGQKVWVVTPYVGLDPDNVVVQDCSKRKMWRAIYTKRSGAGYGGYCDLGVWDADFELHIALK